MSADALRRTGVDRYVEPVIVVTGTVVVEWCRQMAEQSGKPRTRTARPGVARPDVEVAVTNAHEAGHKILRTLALDTVPTHAVQQ